MNPGSATQIDDSMYNSFENGQEQYSSPIEKQSAQKKKLFKYDQVLIKNWSKFLIDLDVQKVYRNKLVNE